MLSAADAAVEEARERDHFRRGEIGRPFHRLTQLEPLFVYSLNAARAWKDSKTVGVYHLPLMPDRFSLFGEHGEPWEYTVAVPCAAADAPLQTRRPETTFVAYLRECFRWGGFPGWAQIDARPEPDLSFLTEGLLPM